MRYRMSEGMTNIGTPLKEAMERTPRPQEPEQEPVGKFAKFTDGIWREVTDGSAGVPLYTAPPQHKE